MKKNFKKENCITGDLIKDFINSMIVVDSDFKIITIGTCIGRKLYKDARVKSENLLKSLPEEVNIELLKNAVTNVLKNNEPEKYKFKSVNLNTYIIPAEHEKRNCIFVVDEEEIIRTKKIERELEDRVKELSTLYSIGSELKTGKKLDKVLENIAGYINAGVHYPDSAFIEIEFDGEKYYTKGKKPVKLTNIINAAIETQGKKRGNISIGYKGNYDFVDEEKQMLSEISRTMSKAIERIELETENRKYVGKLEDLVAEKTRELEKSVKRYDDLFEYAPDGIVISTFEGTVVRANRAFYRMMKFPEDGSVKLHYVKDNLYNDIKKDRPYIIKKLKKDRRIEGYEFNLRDKTGKPVPVIGSINLIEMDGELYDEAIFKDIRLRKELEQKLIEQNENLEKIIKERTEDLERQKDIQVNVNRELMSITEKLRESKNKLQTLFNAITDTVVMIDTNFNIQMSNRENIGEHGKCYEMVFNLDKKCDDCPGIRVFEEKRAVTHERKIGEDYYRMQAYPIFNNDGEIEGAIEFSRMITKEKNMELQLLQADKLASLGQLVSGIAHEINNPNTFIRGNILIIQEALKDILPILTEYYKDNPDLKIARLNYDLFRENIPVLVEDMVKGADRIKNIVDDLRKFAKRDEGLLKDDVDINVCVESSLRLVRNNIKRNANVKLDLDLNVPAIMGNNQKLEQVLVNMFINASQAIEQERGTITVSTRYDDSRKEIVIKIADDGKGMDEHTQKQIFNPFFTTKRNKGGTGLGLSIAYGIIKEHDGRITVASETGTGTTFTICLPVYEKSKTGNTAIKKETEIKKQLS